MKRSSQWSKVRNAFIKRNPFCAACGGKTKLEIHHIVPFHINPALELVESNLITLCESRSNGVTCHALFGHLGSYVSWNVNVVEDARQWLDKLKNRPKKEKKSEKPNETVGGEV